MSEQNLEQELVSLIQGAQPEAAAVVEPVTGRSLVVRLQGLLGLAIDDRTDYGWGRSYQLQLSLPVQEGDRWIYHVRVKISGMGPYVMHSFHRESVSDSAWGGPCHTSRGGYTEEHNQFAERLRGCYKELGWTEVSEQIRGKSAPGPKGQAEDATIHTYLFR